MVGDGLGDVSKMERNEKRWARARLSRLCASG